VTAHSALVQHHRTEHHKSRKGRHKNKTSGGSDGGSSSINTHILRLELDAHALQGLRQRVYSVVRERVCRACASEWPLRYNAVRESSPAASKWPRPRASGQWERVL
jgi:hypothetical protein